MFSKPHKWGRQRLLGGPVTTFSLLRQWDPVNFVVAAVWLSQVVGADIEIGSWDWALIVSRSHIMLPVNWLDDIMTGVCFARSNTCKNKERKWNSIYLYARCWGLDSRQWEEMRALTDCQKKRLMSHGAYIETAIRMYNLCDCYVLFSPHENESRGNWGFPYKWAHDHIAQHNGPLTQLP